MTASSSPSPRLSTVHDVACTACGCVCDDLTVNLVDNTVQSFSPPCPLAEKWFASASQTKPFAATIRGVPCSLEEGIAEAASIWKAARAPLVYGLSNSSTPGQRAAVHLADRSGACIDTSASVCHGPSILAVQAVGESTCTLGEVRHRADLVVYWGSNPAKSQPRHMQRYAVDPPGQFVPGGRSDRTVIVFDTLRTRTAEAADSFVPLQPGTDFDLLWALRMAVQGMAIPENVAGVSRTTIEDLAARMKSCHCGVFFFGRGLTAGACGHANVETLLHLVRELNAFTRFHARRMRVFGDVTGADAVLAWQTGFPFSVNLAHGYPRYGPGEYSAPVLLQRGEVDACLLVGSEGLGVFSKNALRQLQSIPTILIEHAHAPLAFEPTVRIVTGVYGIHHPGTAYRMDEVPIPLRVLVKSPLPSDAEVLQAILRRFQCEKS